MQKLCRAPEEVRSVRALRREIEIPIAGHLRQDAILAEQTWESSALSGRVGSILELF
jgi:hypothetical protein